MMNKLFISILAVSNLCPHAHFPGADEHIEAIGLGK